MKRIFITLFTSLLGILLMGAIPFAFNGTSFKISSYSEGLKMLLSSLTHPFNIMYPAEATSRTLFPDILEPYIYSMIVLFSALFLAIIVALTLSILISLLPKPLYKASNAVLFVFESLPDVLIAVLVQFLIIWFYKKTNILLFNIASWGNEQPYTLPILCLSVLPIILSLRILLFHMEEEWEEPYIENAKSKGLTRLYILLHHVLPNTLVHFFHQSKMILWFMLSNLLVIEILFNIYGITNFVYRHGNPAVFTIASMLVFIPMYAFFVLGSMWTNKWAIQNEMAATAAAQSSFSFQPYWLIIKRFLLRMVRPLRYVGAQPLFVAGFCIIGSMLVLSMIHNYAFDNEIPKTQVLYAKDGITALGRSPFEPSSRFWFGTDQFGSELLYKIVSGAKYTLGLAFFISLTRLLFSFAGGYLFFAMNPRFKEWLKGIVDSTHYVPVALLCYFILFPVVLSEGLTFWQKGMFHIIILTLVAVPAISVMIGSEMELISNKEFVSSARVLGGGRFHVFYKHLLPHMLPKLSFIYIQQIMYVLILFAHLGLLQMFFGGTVLEEYTMQGGDFIPISMSNEWSGLIGSYYRQMLLRPYLIIIPVVFFAVAIIGVNLMLEGLKKAIEDLQWGRKKFSHPASIMIVAVTVVFCYFAVHKFSDDFTEKKAIAAAQKKSVVKIPIVELDKETLDRFEDGEMNGVKDLYFVGSFLDRDTLKWGYGKPVKTKEYEKRTDYYYKEDGYQIILSSGFNRRVSRIQVQYDSTREDILKAMKKKPDKETKKTLDYLRGDYLVRFTQSSPGHWWISIQDQYYFR
ncbi:ABC transporter permease subunit [Fictibacillus sp. KIGAM418]|uniref:ABC transporter permease subunit n=1 Tax=Fictibacillus marinisediminis TaxID=2878389 RepID=A0A9X1XFQ5_9BACL|nr:ABC transporter permease subunit [Fictibacillus marinisediminis]MCK6259055.1 ABC transporter permease subunit [Fictibacillus marinisediminis]